MAHQENNVKKKGENMKRKRKIR